MEVTFKEAVQNLDAATSFLLCESDKRIQAVGINRTGKNYGYFVIIGTREFSPYGGPSRPIPNAFRGIPVDYQENSEDLESLLRIPYLSSYGSHQPEQDRHRQLVCGIQIQNFDDDERAGLIAAGDVCLGTLGCFVEWQDRICLLSNSHVLTHTTAGHRGADRIFQPGVIVPDSNDHEDPVAILEEFTDLAVSPDLANAANGMIIYNRVDAGIASLITSPKRIDYRQEFSLHHPIGHPIFGVDDVESGDIVYKVGRTTGFREGRVAAVLGKAGPFRYNHGRCWFDGAIIIEDVAGSRPFSDRGDSGSVIVKSNGAVVGLLYGGGGKFTFASPIKDVENMLNCKVI